MRLTKNAPQGIVEADMTPMIDMAFQLIAFFMVLINFSDVEVDQRLTLPASELAKPPETAYDEPIAIQMMRNGVILFGGEELSLEGLKVALRREAEFLNRFDGKNKDGKKGVERATVIVRADLAAKAGQVQQVIQACQDAGFDQFALRGKQSDTPTLVEP
jgi:biopolymer transport protein ExbD